MLKRLEVKHFKSLDDFAIDFEPFTVLIGQNGSGKTTVLQALDLLGAFLRGDVNHYLKELGWDYSTSLVSKASTVSGFQFNLFFEAEMDEFRWHVHFGPGLRGLKVIEEELTIPAQPNFSFHSYPDHQSWELCDTLGTRIPLADISIEFPQSILRAFKIKNAPIEIESAAVALDKIFMFSVDSITALRKNGIPNLTVEKLGREGQNLTNYLYTLQLQKRTKQFSDLVARFVPQIRRFKTTNVDGEIVLSIEEKFAKGLDPYHFFEIFSDHISEGTLRIFALLATLLSADRGSTLLLDEIENAVDPNHLNELVNVLEEYIREKELQIILATHSPMIVNFVPENGIRYFSREKNGNVVGKKLFDRKELKKMLEYMGPGEIWMNLSERDLVGED